MHSKIYQISNKPIATDDYVCPEDFYENSSSWADYIGHAVTSEYDRHEYIRDLVESLNGLLTLNEDYSMTYNGGEDEQKFLQEWADRLRELTVKLKAENILSDMNLIRIREFAKRTHIQSYSRFYIKDWIECGEPMSEFVAWMVGALKQGDRIYVGAIIDFHC